MRFSVWPWLSKTWPELSDLVRHVEATGWDGLYVADHFMGDGGTFGAVESPLLESTASLAAIAGETSRLRLGTIVLGVTYRHPAVLAKWASTLDHASGGRLLLGVGAAWQQNEHDQYGIELGSVRERVDRFGEALEVLTGLLNEPRTTVHGRHYQVTDAVCEPKPIQSPLPMLVGAKGDRMLGHAARFAAEWNMWSTPETNAERASVLAAHCERIGRDPEAIVRSTQALVFVADDPSPEALREQRELAQRYAPRPSVAGTAEQIAEQVAAYAEVGVSEFIVPDFTLGTGAQRTDRLDALIEAFAPLRG
jgi:alkanesulfonate monooxygenase SsuD/methylene tetrahydromethanopterin reductase-like flavin-dependent oxidoreductase (luciferase family)